MNNPLGKFILSELDKKRMSQRDLSIAVGVSEPHISRVIKGERGPSIRLCNELATA